MTYLRHNTGRMARRQRAVLTAVPIVMFLLSGCDLLLGADPEPAGGQIAWTSGIITTGEISGLDATVSPAGQIAVSYLHEEGDIRVSHRSGDSEWVHVTGPVVSGPLATEHTRVASRTDGTKAVIYYSDSDLHVATVDQTFDVHPPLGTLEADLIRGTRPLSWAHESTQLAYGPDDRLRAVVRDVDSGRLWLFRETGSGWELDYIDGSLSTEGPVDLVIGASGNEHIVFWATGLGWYWWQKASATRWEERLQIPNDPPYRIELRSDESSVLAAQYLDRIRVAEEVFDEQSGTYSWLAREVVYHENLHWHNLDMVLDDLGLPGILYILGPFWGETFEVWFARLMTDGTWHRSLVARDLDLATFNPFHVRLVREPAGRVHVFLTSGRVKGSSGGLPVYEHQLLDIWTDDPGGGS